MDGSPALSGSSTNSTSEVKVLVDSANASAALASTLGILSASRTAWRRLTRSNIERFLEQQEMFEATLSRADRIRKFAEEHDRLAPVAELADEFEATAVNNMQWAFAQVKWVRTRMHRLSVFFTTLSAVCITLGLISAFSGFAQISTETVTVTAALACAGVASWLVGAIFAFIIADRFKKTQVRRFQGRRTSNTRTK